MKVVCNACASAFAVSEELIKGKTLRFRCRKCGSSIPVHGTGVASTSAASPDAARQELISLPPNAVSLPPEALDPAVAPRPAPPAPRPRRSAPAAPVRTTANGTAHNSTAHATAPATPSPRAVATARATAAARAVAATPANAMAPRAVAPSKPDLAPVPPPPKAIAPAALLVANSALGTAKPERAPSSPDLARPNAAALASAADAGSPPPPIRTHAPATPPAASAPILSAAHARAPSAPMLPGPMPESAADDAQDDEHQPTLAPVAFDASKLTAPRAFVVPAPAPRRGFPAAQVLAITTLIGLSAGGVWRVLNTSNGEAARTVPDREHPAIVAPQPTAIAVDPSSNADPAADSKKSSPPAVSASPPAAVAATAEQRPAPAAAAPRAVTNHAAPRPRATESNAENGSDEKTATAGAEFDQSAAVAALTAAGEQARSCVAAGTAGVARVAVTFAPSGRATNAVVEGAPFAGTIEGSCIATKFRSAEVPPFDGDGTVTVRKSVRLDE